MALISADEVIGCPRCSTEVRLDTSGVKQNSPSWYVLDEPKSHRLTAVAHCRARQPGNKADCQ
jgi:hypothetical protein